MPPENDPFVTVVTASGSVEAEMMQDVLRQEGIESTIQGSLHAGMLGAAGVLLRVPVQVPKSRADDAKQILEALERYDAVVTDEGEIPELDADEREAHRNRLESLAEGRTIGEGAYRAGPPGYANRPYPPAQRRRLFCRISLSRRWTFSRASRANRPSHRGDDDPQRHRCLWGRVAGSGLAWAASPFRRGRIAWCG